MRKRLYWHQNPETIEKSFTYKYKCFFLIYYEHFSDVDTAINREKQIKGWARIKKDNIIKGFNPSWKFLNDEI
ncbi:GIY-YIG nuclease family protein [Chryseobacterium gilvum]|uniref:GIY-YIG nuclease family protein n=1 Tax=Chryseobacterium gilvum TaxID=2976534 RepID=UPI0034A4FFCB